MQWIIEVDNINQLVGVVADLITIVGISGIGIGCLIIYKKIINISITYYNFLLMYPEGINNENIYSEGFGSGLHDIKIK